MNQPNADAAQTAEQARAAPGEQGAALELTGTLQQELDKWRERVPRLLTALRERSDEVERLQAELAALRDAPAAPMDLLAPGQAGESPGARAREAVIDELERELGALRDAHAALQGELHARSLTLGGLKRDLQGWKGKWQDLARKLDDVPATSASDTARLAELGVANGRLGQALEAANRTVAELTGERDALQSRNANLFETTERASRQMEVLADDLAELRGQLKSLRGEHDATLGELDALRQERDDLAESARTARAEVEGLETLLQSLQAAALAASADRAAEERVAAARLAEFTAERAALLDEVEQAVARAGELESARAAADGMRDRAEQACAEAEGARVRVETALAEARSERELADRVRAEAEEARRQAEALAADAHEALGRAGQETAAHLARGHQLERQLEERSALVRGLEQELIERGQLLDRLESGRRELEDGLLRANRNAKEHAEYVLQLDGRVERQKQLLVSLEQELSGAQAIHVGAVREHENELSARDAEIRALELQVAALQRMLQDREAPAGGPGGDGPGDEPVAPDPLRAERDDRTLRVLSQQLKDARIHSDTLLERIRELETRALVNGEGQADDDLTRIHGVGPRLAQHLRQLGVRTYQQIAELDPEALDDPTHALSPLRSRILRDGWIEQAVSLYPH